MEQDFKPMTKELAIAALILTAVTVLSLGIRQVRLNAHRANTVESPVIADAEPDHYAADSHTVDAERDSQYANASDSAEEVPSDDYSEAHTDSGKRGKAASMTKPFKGDYAKAKSSKSLQKISLGDNENLYITAEGRLFYVSEQPDGKTVKMQVHIDDITGEMIIVDSSDGKSDGSQGLERISMGDNEDLYITGDGELWYTSEGSKTQVQIDDTTGEITVIEHYGGDGGK
jgi:hypothetical protein